MDISLGDEQNRLDKE